MKTIFGPVPSRRLGLSLGVDLVPPKTCTFDCLYCECGPTTRLLDAPRPLIDPALILEELAAVLAWQEERLDYVTLSGAGEPTLHSELGRIVAGIKTLTEVPLAIITNSALLHRTEVLEALAPIDLILPSLDTAREETFKRLNRPHPAVTMDMILKGLTRLKTALKAEVWLEMLLVAGLNDSPGEVAALKEAAELIRPDRIQINTVDRPPADSSARAVSYARLEEIAAEFGPQAEVIARRFKDFRPGRETALAEAVLEIIDRRPCTRKDLEMALGVDEEEIGAVLKVLMVKGRVRGEKVEDRLFVRGVAQEA